WQITQVFGVADALSNGFTFGQRSRLIAAQPDQAVGLSGFAVVVLFTFGGGVTVQCIAEGQYGLFGPPGGGQGIGTQRFQCQGDAAFDTGGGRGDGVENFYGGRGGQGFFTGANQQHAPGFNTGDGR